MSLTQQQVADGIKQVPDSAGRLRELTRAAYAQWEVGLTTPDIERVRAAAQVLGVTPAYLAFGDGVGGTAADDTVWLAELGVDLVEVASRWAIPREFADGLACDNAKLRIARVSAATGGASFAQGSIVILDTGVTSVTCPGTYAFSAASRLGFALMAPRPSSASRVMVQSGSVSFEEAAEDLDIRGKVIRAWADVG